MVATPTPFHPNFTFLFLAVYRTTPHEKPHRKAIIAPNERSARQHFEPDFILFFAGRLPVQEVRHV
ncbi:host cell division inhibitor Icd-like protein [Pectobacterium punjabense]|uniref:host cell division inhibitor Icd-like protein n=1 Tax=Pectobacterium punjabense TaxID=2108399 RepID=UPI0031200A73